jgi:transcriptional regulator with XRE-family HTH domain
LKASTGGLESGKSFRGRKRENDRGKKERGTGFAAALKRLREEAGLSQAALAEKAGMNVFGVAKIEQGLREPGWATVLKLADALGVECTAFCEGPGERKEAKKRRQARSV